ncbi:MAG: PadR family transcriptional regulator [Gemmatimonadota bacterium]|jgi:DNA-binding PadR family transcriptional regulator
MGRKCNDFGFGEWAAFCGPGFAAFGPRVRSGRGRQRFGRRGDLKYVILSLLDDRPMHGYEIIRRLEEDSGGIYSPSPGSIYPTLQMLEDRGSVISEQQEGKRVYRITDEGRTLLGEHGDRVSDFTDRFSDFTDRFSTGGMGDLTRTFVRLAQVSFERATRKAADPEALGKLQEILERATRDVEESWPGPGKRASSKS